MAPKAPAKTVPSRMRGYKAYLAAFREKVTVIAKDIFAKVRHRPVVTTRPGLKFTDYWMLTIRLAAIGIIISGITLGARREYISIGLSRMFGEEVDADLKLAFLGFFNKSLDVLLVSSLDYMASFLLTVWMAQSTVVDDKRGAMYSDFGLKDELTKPWMTIASFITRWHRSRLSWRNVFRCLLCLCVSVSVMLQGLAVNTVAIPKKRWYPNYQKSWKMTAHDQKTMRIEHPKVSLQGVDWLNILSVGQSNIGGEGYPPWDWALGMSASLAFTGLTNVVSTVRETQKGWKHVYNYRLDGDPWKRWTALDTNFRRSNGSVETISADDGQVTSVYNWLKETNHQPTSSSIGWTGNLTLALPVLNTICTPIESPHLEGSIIVRPPAKNESSEAMITIEFGPVASLGFAGAACSSRFRQGLYAVNVWIVDSESPDISFNHYGIEWDQKIVYERATGSDFDVANGLGNQARDIMPRLELLVPSTRLLPQFILMSRNLQVIDPVVDSDAMGLSIITGVPIQWQLYGSGPRMTWEWVAVAVLAIVLLSFCFGLYQTLRYWMAPGLWVQLDGMMMIAQRTPPLEGIEDEERARKRIYLVEEDGSGKLILKSKAG